MTISESFLFSDRLEGGNPSEPIVRRYQLKSPVWVDRVKDLAKRLNEMEQKYDSQFRIVFDAIKKMMAPPEKDKKKIGFEV